MHDELLDQKVEDDTYGEDETEVGQKFNIGITPFGHIGISITQNDGQQATYVITSPDEGSKIAMHMFALTSMMIQSGYATAMQEQQLAKQLLGEDKLWVPGT